MRNRILQSIIPFATILLGPGVVPAHAYEAAAPRDVHAYFQQERARSDGGPAYVHQPPKGTERSARGELRASARDLYFEFERTRTDGGPLAGPHRTEDAAERSRALAKGKTGGGV